jgi:hypothetical protein
MWQQHDISRKTGLEGHHETREGCMEIQIMMSSSLQSLSWCDTKPLTEESTESLGTQPGSEV